MSPSTLLLSFLILGLSTTPLTSKTLEVQEGCSPYLVSMQERGLLTDLVELLQHKLPLKYIFKSLIGDTDDKTAIDSLEGIVCFLNKHGIAQAFQETLEEKIKVNKNILKPLLKITTKMKTPIGTSSDGSATQTLLGDIIRKYMAPDTEDNESVEHNEGISAISFQNKLMETTINLLEGKLGNLDFSFMVNATNLPTDMASLNSTYSTIWMMVKSTWQRILSYVKEENSLETFMQLTPVRIIDNIISLGDDINLMNFLAKKLDQDFAEFLASEVNPYLGPLRDFESFYNFTKESGYNGVIDYFTSEKFTYTVNVISKLISAYLEDTVSDDLLNQYIQFIAFNNTELLNFYKSVLNSQHNTVNSDSNTDNSTQRFKRDVLESIANSYVQDLRPDQIATGTEEQNLNSRQLNARYPMNTMGSMATMGTMGMPNHLYDPSRDGGYGGGGYGGGSYLDPYVVLGALALGTILGFLIFRALRGTRNGRRDIGDGSLSLWDSDLPHQILPWGSSVDRMKRQVNDDTQSFSLPSSLRGDVWSSDPLVTDNFLDDHLDEDDIAHHLNHLWRLYKDTNETACVHSHLCDVMANSTAHHLTGKDSSLPLIMASVGNLLGVAGSGQLMDDVTSSLVWGNSFTCPSIISCHQF